MRLVPKQVHPGRRRGGWIKGNIVHEEMRQMLKRIFLSASVSSWLLDSTGRVSDIYRVTGTPTSYLIDRKGKIIGWEVGYREWFSKNARDLIEGLLGSE